MHLYFERNLNAKCDCNILSLSWMGKLPEELQEDESWKLYRRKYYQEGWLATGNARGLVGVTYTTSHCRTRVPELPARINYNLRGHRSEVILVKWNEPYQKLASCDSTGVIFVWIKYDGRWSIELINDRNTPVTHFSWSHDGRMALICYKDGFVLVGSVAGQRYWSSMLNHKAVITCGIWTPDDQQVYFGTTAGQLIVMDVHGAMVSEVQLGAGVTSMAWSVEKFKLDEDDEDGNDYDDERDNDEEREDEDETETSGTKRNRSRVYVLAVCLADGKVVLLRSFDDVSPVTIRTELKSPLHAEWSNSRKFLAVAGSKDQEHYYNQPYEYTNLLKFYSETGALIYTIVIPNTQSPVTAMTWGHNDRRLFVATGTQVHAAWVSRGVGSLQLLSRLALKAALAKESLVKQLPLPPRLKALVSGLFASTIRSDIPEPRDMRRFVSRPPHTRLYCTMLRNPGDPPHSYTLYVEYLGGLVPLLKGRRTSKIRPEFVIFDPETGQSEQSCNVAYDHLAAMTVVAASCSDDSDIERDNGVELCGGSPRFMRKNRRKRSNSRERNGGHDSDVDVNYIDTLPENAKLVEVTSNIWGTKFKFHGLTDLVPANLGCVTYRPSLLHLQPRQMTLIITELRDNLPAGPDPTFNPNLFSEDEEDSTQLSTRCATSEQQQPVPIPPIIAPMTNAARLCNARANAGTTANPMPVLSEAKNALQLEDEFGPVPSYCESVRAAAAASALHHRNAYAPRCCDVPALQSPKNAVAPTQTLIATSSPSATIGEYANNVQRMKSALADQHAGTMSNLMKKEHEIINTSSNNKVVYAPSVYTFACGNTRAAALSSGASSATCCMQHCSSPRVAAPPLLNYAYTYGNNNNNSNHQFHNTISNSSCEHHDNNVVATANNNSSSSMVHSKNNFNTNTTAMEANGILNGLNKLTSNGTSSINEDDDEVPALKNQFQLQASHRTPTVVSIGPTQFSANSIVRSCSVGYLDLVDAQIVPCDVALNMLRKDVPNKRLFLISKKNKRRRRCAKDNNPKETNGGSNAVVHRTTKPRLSDCGKSRSLDSSELFPSTEQIIAMPPQLAEHAEETSSTASSSEAAQNEINVRKEAINDQIESRRVKEAIEALSIRAAQLEACLQKQSMPTTGFEPSCLSPIKGSSVSTSMASSLDNLTSRLDGLAVKLGDYEDCRSLPPPSPRPTTRLPRSSPSSPAPSKKGKRAASASPIRRRLLSSPLLSRKSRKNRNESSDEEGLLGQDDASDYRDLETFQKALLRQKLKKRGGNYGYESATRREIRMSNKSPMWNEANQVYQLDFGGRVTQESAKNFQIEFLGNQVMQFGRIQGNAYTLDFQYPFSAIQAFAVALASVTQRLK